MQHLTELISSPQLTVQASDVVAAGLTPKTATTEVVITVQRNPSTPVFDAFDSSVSVSQYLAVGDDVFSLTATDADPPAVRAVFIIIYFFLF